MRRALYATAAPYATHRVAVAAGHVLWVEESGDPRGVAALLLHGGPGAGSDARARGFFDPTRYRTVAVDQRGAGLSTPSGAIEANTTDDLVDDIERVRERLGVERWVICGGSWGATLALAYASRHHARVRALVLRGVSLFDQASLRWLYEYGASEIFPEAWAAFSATTPGADWRARLGHYAGRLTCGRDDEELAAARAFLGWEFACAPVAAGAAPTPWPDERLVACARIATHYALHGGFFGADPLIDRAAVLGSLPAVFVHGRHDVVCPVGGAYALHRRWPASRLVVVEGAGHSSREPGVVDAMVGTTDALAAGQGG